MNKGCVVWSMGTELDAIGSQFSGKSYTVDST